eukprot:TRINITY_DN16721_c0_g1_i1.p1 TRINITY_DN16721_c0_g1~~TRINITY_DN16721_c0_g1_i1.p1  ORF type:complete len:273 (+),score=76.75 TRINITY_DN16721_c0_g1_i1:57-875(+)
MTTYRAIAKASVTFRLICKRGLNQAARRYLSVATIDSLKAKFGYSLPPGSADPLVGLRPDDRLSVVAFDVATTGVGASDRVVELAARDVATGATFCSLVDPGEVLRTSEGSKIHRIEPKQLAEAPDFPTVAADFVRWSESLRASRVFLLAHMFDDFDARHLRAEFERAGLPLPPSWLIVNAMDIIGDALYHLEVASGDGERRLASRDGYVPLPKLAAFFGTAAPTHRAVADINALFEVLRVSLGKAYPQVEFEPMLLFLAYAAAVRRTAPRR